MLFLLFAFTDEGRFAPGRRSCSWVGSGRESLVLPGHSSSGWALLPASSPGNEGFPWQPYLSIASDTDVNFKMKYADHSPMSINKPLHMANLTAF